MPRSVLVVVLLLLALAASTLWFLSGSELAAPNGASPSPAPALGTGASAAKAAPAEAAQVASSPAADAVGRERAALPQESTANGVFLRGRLVDRHGAPRAQVGLQLREWQSHAEFEVFEPARPAQGGQDLPVWRTGEDGRFQIPLHGDRSGALQLVGEDLVFAVEPPTVAGKNGDRDLGDLRVVRAGRIAGVVQDGNGAPVAEMKLGIGVGPLMFGGDRTATTDAAGRFTFGGLRPGNWTLRTASSKFLPTVLDVELGEEAERTDLLVVVRPGHAIAGRVVDERGVGVAGMKVGSQRKEALGGMEIERFAADEATKTDPGGFFTLAGLADDVVTVRAHGPGHTAARLDQVKVGDGNVLLRVQRLGIVEGTLLGADGGPIAGSRVRVAVPGVDLSVEAAPIEELDPMSGVADFRGTVTAADGSFRLENVRPGSVQLAANGSGHRPALQRGVLVEAGQTTRGVRLVAERGAVVNVTVVDDLGKPVEGATVTVQRPRRHEAGDGVHFAVARTVELGDGDQVVGMSGEALGTGETNASGVAQVHGLPDGEVELTARHERFAGSLPTTVSLPANGSADVELALRKAAFASIAVVDAEGASVARAKVELRAADARAGTEPLRGSADDAGKLRLGPLPAGDYVATLAREPKPTRMGGMMMVFGGQGGPIPGSDRPVRLVAGETVDVTLQRPISTRLVGTVLGAEGPVAGCVVDLEPQLEGTFGDPVGGASATTGADGTFTIDDVAPGAYTLRFGTERQTVKCSQDVAVPPGIAEIRQDLQLRTGTLRARIVSSTGQPVVGAEVEVVSAANGPRREQRMMMVSMVMGDTDGGGVTTMSMGGTRVRSANDGSVEIVDVPAGEWSLRVTHKEFAPVTSKAATVVERQVTDVGTVTMVAGGNVRGAVLAASGEKLGMGLVYHRAAGTQEWSEPAFAQGGAFRIVSLPPGRHELRAQELGNGAEESFSAVVEVDVVAGQTATAELRMPAR